MATSQSMNEYEQSSLNVTVTEGQSSPNGAHSPPCSQSGAPPPTTATILDVHRGKPVRLQVKVVVPTADHPNYNFVGKLLGPKGNSLKWLQEQTATKMAILGRGSMRNKEKEDELRRLSDPKYAHLHEDLHVEISTFAPAPEAYLRMSNALFEIKRFLVPDYYDEIRKQQLRELGVLNADGSEINAGTQATGGFNSYSQSSDCQSSSPPLLGVGVGSAVAAASAASGAPGGGRDLPQPSFSCWTNSDFREMVTESTGSSVASSYWPPQGQPVVVTNGHQHQHHQQPPTPVHTHRVPPSSSQVQPFKGILRPPLGVHPHQQQHQHKPYSRPVPNS